MLLDNNNINKHDNINKYIIFVIFINLVCYEDCKHKFLSLTFGLILWKSCIFVCNLNLCNITL